jgi:hypothetical protein
MVKYKCKNYGNCDYADDRREFTPANTVNPTCPGCGRADRLRLVAGGKKPLPMVALGVFAVVAIIGVAAWLLFNKSTPPAPGPVPVVAKPESRDDPARNSWAHKSADDWIEYLRIDRR